MEFMLEKQKCSGRPFPAYEELFEQLARSIWRLFYDETIDIIEAQQQAWRLLYAIVDWEERMQERMMKKKVLVTSLSETRISPPPEK